MKAFSNEIKSQTFFTFMTWLLFVLIKIPRTSAVYWVAWFVESGVYRNAIKLQKNDSGNCTGRGSIITNLHVICERMRIFLPFFADDNNIWWQSRQQNPTFVSWLIQKKSDKTTLETIPLSINLAGRSRKWSGVASRYY